MTLTANWRTSMSIGNDNLLKYKNIHEGERCFILGGGPSIKDTDLSLLEGEIVLTTGLSNFSFSNYHFIGDKNITSQHIDRVRNIQTDTMFVSKGIYHEFFDYDSKNVEYFVGSGRKGFYTEVNGGVYGGGSSVIVAAQFAHFMGMSPAYLLGIDHKWNFSNSIPRGVAPNGSAIWHNMEKKDLNHHTDDYYPEGTDWHHPQTEKIENSFGMATTTYFMTGRRLYNASIRTELSEEFVPRVDYYSLFNHD